VTDRNLRAWEEKADRKAVQARGSVSVMGVSIMTTPTCLVLWWPEQSLLVLKQTNLMKL
jgi:hypothetical protein